MAEPQPPRPRPWWVCFAARARVKRATALTQVSGFVLLAGIGLAVAGIESASTSLLGSLVVPLGLAEAGVCAVAALWSWLAVRWVDRHCKWA